jgi:hypothetical protein
MTTQEIIQDYRLREWALMVTEQRDSGHSVRKWCAEQGINVKTYYYRRNRVREELTQAANTTDIMNQVKSANKTVFAALPMPKSRCAAITVHIGGNTAEIQNGTDAETIENVVRVLSRL